MLRALAGSRPRRYCLNPPTRFCLCPPQSWAHTARVTRSPSMTGWKRPQNTGHTAISEWLNSLMVSCLLIDSSLFDTFWRKSSLVDLPTTQQPNDPRNQKRQGPQSWPKYPLSSSEASLVKAPSLAHLRWTDFRQHFTLQEPNLLVAPAYLLSAPSPPNHPGQQKACTQHTCRESWATRCWWKCVGETDDIIIVLVSFWLVA